ncbi:MYCBP-associated protein isoform X2 [Ochotona princeps]|uniref:MYCBP-associated protein isoform X2 n=1 Tax=Ochotona princeps TaxID=9978 RepID=UPI002714CA3E|nr:MYCBP-associated protein isoform X2 [Ochotona princeps]
MKSLKKESRLRIPPNRFMEATESVKDKKRPKVAEQPTPPIQEEPEPVSNVLQGDDILALAIKTEDLKKQHIPHLSETEDRPVITQKFIIRKLKPRDPRRKVCRLVAHPASPDVTTKPVDYYGSGSGFNNWDRILPHHILGSLQDFKRIAVARGNTQLAKLIHSPPCLLTLISAKEESKPKTLKEKKRLPWAPPPQHNFLKNWQHHLILRKRQQEALSEHLKKPVGELLMHTGETYRQIQEEREHIDRLLPTQHDGKAYEEPDGFWAPLEYLGNEMTGLLMTKTKTQRGLVEPVTHIRKPHCIQVETGLLAQRNAWYRYTWDRSVFLICRRKELQSLLAERGLGLQDPDRLEVVGRRQPCLAVAAEDSTVLPEGSHASSSVDTVHLDLLATYPDTVSMPILGPSLLFCGKPAVWIRGSNPQDKRHVGISVCLTFETLEGEKTSSELTVVNNGTVAIWYDWRRWPQLDAFQSVKRNRGQRFYFDNRQGVILPRETKNFTFFFKSLNAGIFRESWEFGTHPILLGGAVLQVNLHAISLAQDTLRDERKLLEKKLAAHEAVSIAKSLLPELLMGVLTPEPKALSVDTYLTEEDLFHHQNPQLHYRHQVVQNLQRLWRQYMILLPKEAWPSEEEPLNPRALVTVVPSSYLEKAPATPELLPRYKSPLLEGQLSRQENRAFWDIRDSSTPQKTGAGVKSAYRKSIMEEILVEENLDMDSPLSAWDMDSLPLPKWSLCLQDFRKAVMPLPEESHREDALVRLNKAALELCQEQRPVQCNFLHQMCLQLWRVVIDSLVSHSLWLRVLLGLPEKETVYLEATEEPDQKPTPAMEVKVPPVRVGKEERRGAAQEKKQTGIRDKEDKKGAKMPGKEERLNSKKQKVKEEKKLTKSSSRDRLSEETAHDSTTPSQEPIDPLIMEKYTQRLHTEVCGLLNTLVTDLMTLADELSST